MQTIANRGANHRLLSIALRLCGKLGKSLLDKAEGRGLEPLSDFSRRISSATCKRTLAATFGRYLSKTTPEASLTNLNLDVSGRLRCLRSLSEMLTTNLSTEIVL